MFLGHWGFRCLTSHKLGIASGKKSAHLILLLLVLFAFVKSKVLSSNFSRRGKSWQPRLSWQGKSRHCSHSIFVLQGSRRRDLIGATLATPTFMTALEPFKVVVTVKSSSKLTTVLLCLRCTVAAATSILHPKG